MKKSKRKHADLCSKKRKVSKASLDTLSKIEDKHSITNTPPQICKKEFGEAFKNIFQTPSSTCGDDTTSTHIITKKPPSGEPFLRINYNEMEKPLSLNNLQELVLWCLHEDGINPNLFFVRNRHCIDKVVLLHIPGLHPSMILSEASDNMRLMCPKYLHDPEANVFPLYKKIIINHPLFSYILPVVGPGGRSHIEPITPSFLNTLPKDLQKNLFKEKKKGNRYFLLEQQKSPNVNRTQRASEYIEIPHTLLLSESLLLENSFPIHPVYPNHNPSDYANDWIHSPIDAIQLEKKHWKMLSIDCEMCTTDLGPELTRVSIVTHDRKVLLDEYVLPKNPILDYCTPYSGITEKHLIGITTCLKDIQEILLEIVDDSCVLVGHSLENDLRALKFTHPYVIDTSVLYTRGPNMKHALRYLSYNYLQRSIQKSHSSDGHCSIEDAVAALDLALLKVQETEMSKSENKPFPQNLMSLLKHGLVSKSTALISSQAMELEYQDIMADHKITYTSFDDFLPAMEKALSLDAPLIYSELDVLKSISPENLSNEDRETICTALDTISQVYNRLPKRTLFIAFSASSHPSLFQNAQLAFRKSPRDARQPEFLKLLECTQRAKEGCCFIHLKTA